MNINWKTKLDDYIGHDPSLSLYIDILDYCFKRKSNNTDNESETCIINKIIDENKVIRKVVKSILAEALNSSLYSATDFFRIYPFSPKFYEPINEMSKYNRGSETLKKYFNEKLNKMIKEKYLEVL